jgi:hypothetical protein
MSVSGGEHAFDESADGASVASGASRTNFLDEFVDFLSAQVEPLTNLVQLESADAAFSEQRALEMVRLARSATIQLCYVGRLADTPARDHTVAHIQEILRLITDNSRTATQDELRLLVETLEYFCLNVTGRPATDTAPNNTYQQRANKPAWQPAKAKPSNPPGAAASAGGKSSTPHRRRGSNGGLPNNVQDWTKDQLKKHGFKYNHRYYKRADGETLLPV